MPKVDIFTDGSCLGNPGPGGWGAILRHGTNEREISGGRRLTTNNRMEMLACIRALGMLKRGCQVTLHSDSKYVINAFTEGWISGWRKKNWRGVKNADLWQQLIAAVALHQVDWVWVKGHNGHPENERVDALAREAAARADLPIDEGYMASQNSKAPAARPLAL